MTDDETKAMRDALTFGTGYMLDGKHVPMEAVMTDDLVKRLRSKNCCDATKCNCDEAANRIEAQDKRNKELEAALRKIAEEGSKALVSTWDTPAESVRQDFAHLWARLAICVDDAEEALGEKNDASST